VDTPESAARALYIISRSAGLFGNQLIRALFATGKSQRAVVGRWSADWRDPRVRHAPRTARLNASGAVCPLSGAANQYFSASRLRFSLKSRRTRRDGGRLVGPGSQHQPSWSLKIQSCRPDHPATWKPDRLPRTIFACRSPGFGKPHPWARPPSGRANLFDANFGEHVQFKGQLRETACSASLAAAPEFNWQDRLPLNWVSRPRPLGAAEEVKRPSQPLHQTTAQGSGRRQSFASSTAGMACGPRLLATA